MINEIIKTELSVGEIENYVTDTEKILTYLCVLIKEYSVKEDIDTWLNGYMALLFECFVNLNNLNIFLKELASKHLSKKGKDKKIKMSTENLMVISSYLKNFQVAKKELLYLYSIMIHEFDVV
jgi:hypothetical protein